MTRTVRAIVVDDHPLMAQATKDLLIQVEGVTVEGVVHNGGAALELADAVQPDLILLDYQLPDMTGTKVAELLKERHPNAYIVLFTGVDVSDLTLFAMSNYLSGVVSKGAREETIKHIIACVLDNQIVLPRTIFQRLKLPASNYALDVELTEEECTLMAMIVRGETYDRVAEQLFISKRSVDNYLRRIYEKMGVQTRIQAIERFVQSKQYAEMQQ